MRVCLNCGKELTKRQTKYCSRSCLFSHSNKGKNKPMLESTKKKISESKKGVKFSESHKKNLREACMGKVVSQETRDKLRQANVGKTRSEEQRQNISKGKTGVKFSETHKSNLSKALSGRHLSESTKSKISSSYSKRMTDVEYYLSNPVCENTSEYRRRAIEHYGHICENCGVSDDFMEVHHLDADKTNNNLDNLSVLCRTCHRTKAHIRGSSKADLNKDFSNYIRSKRII